MVSFNKGAEMARHVYRLAERPAPVELFAAGIIDRWGDDVEPYAWHTLVGAVLTGEHRQPRAGEWYVPRTSSVAHRCEVAQFGREEERIARIVWTGPDRSGLVAMDWRRTRTWDLDAASCLRAALGPVAMETPESMAHVAAAIVPGLVACLDAAGWRSVVAECRLFFSRWHRLVEEMADLERARRRAEGGPCITP